MREIVHLQAGQCGNQIGAKVTIDSMKFYQILALQTSKAGREVPSRRVSCSNEKLIETKWNNVLFSVVLGSYLR